MLVGSTGPFATLAGRHALEAGGSATDAVLATAFTQIALSLGSWVSYAGLFGVVQYDAASNETTTVSAGFGTFAQETDPATIPAAPQPSGRTALVPGFIAGAAAAHERAGRLPWDRLWSPARDLIARGVPINDHLERLLDARESTLTRTPAGRAAFAPDGRLPRSGDRFRQPQLAAIRTVPGAGSGNQIAYAEPADANLISADPRRARSRLVIDRHPLSLHGSLAVASAMTMTFAQPQASAALAPSAA